MNLNTDLNPQTGRGVTVAEQLKMPVAGDLVARLHERFVGQRVEVRVPGYKGEERWTGILAGVARDGGGLVLDFGDLLIPWSKVNSLRIAPPKTN